MTAVASCAASLRRPLRGAILGVLRAPKTADGRHGDTVDENQRGLRSADVTWTLVDGTVTFHVRFSKVILTAPALLPQRRRVASQPSGAGEVIEDGRAGTGVVCRIDRYDGCGHSGAARTVAHHPRVPRHHLRRCDGFSRWLRTAPPRLGGRPLAMSKNLSTPHATIC